MIDDTYFCQSQEEGTEKLFSMHIIVPTAENRQHHPSLYMLYKNNSVATADIYLQTDAYEDDRLAFAITLFLDYIEDELLQNSESEFYTQVAGFISKSTEIFKSTISPRATLYINPLSERSSYEKQKILRYIYNTQSKLNQ